MDPTRFDALVRTFATEGTRRRLLALLAGLPLGGLLTTFDEDEAAAERPRDRVKRRNKQHHRKQRNQRRRKHNNKHNNKGGKGGSDNCTANGGACNENSDCCQGNCFNQRCSNTVNQCDGTACPANATGCCSEDGCCASPANQCNDEGLCCAPNCDGKQCGPDGCGNSGTCGSCKPGVVCDESSGKCACTQQCQGKECGNDGCGGSCGTCPAGQHCNPIGLCEGQRICNATLCPNGCCDTEGVCRTDQRSCSGGAGSACCAGCCDVDTQQCMPPASGGGCGLNGTDCVICDPLRGTCADGICQCNADYCPNGCCENGPGVQGECVENDPSICGTGGEQCLSCNGQPCTQDSACSSGNCYDGVCANRVNQCSGDTCHPPAKGCADGVCCYGPSGCGSQCCEAGDSCCGGGDCCAIEGGESCCFNSFCCGVGEQCCDPEKCCPSDWQCCPSSPGVAAHCCPGGTTCCSINNGCCPIT